VGGELSAAMTKATKKPELCVAWWNYSATAEKRRCSKNPQGLPDPNSLWRNADAALQSRMEFGWKTRSVLMWEQKDTT
jgi:hypothetical protein